MFLKKEDYEENQYEMVEYLNKYYEYCYLESMHYINAFEETNTIITGLSYGLNGLESDLMISGNTLNFCMHSQDLYYDFLHVKRAVMNSKGKIKTCIITLGYYSFFYDLSRSSNSSKILTTYIPLFNDEHHMEVADNLRKSNQCNNECIKFYHSFFKREKRSFYNRAISRERTSQIAWEKGGWLNISASERDWEAYQLAEKHNRHILHGDTYIENVSIFNDMIFFLIEHRIRPIVTILPVSKEYLKYIKPAYKELMLSNLETLPYSVEYVDMNDTDIFTEEDILDSDHLNYKGAIKASVLMDEVINNKIV